MRYTARVPLTRGKLIGVASQRYQIIKGLDYIGMANKPGSAQVEYCMSKRVLTASSLSLIKN
jgi:hypothetical protein